MEKVNRVEVVGGFIELDSKYDVFDAFHFGGTNDTEIHYLGRFTTKREAEYEIQRNYNRQKNGY